MRHVGTDACALSTVLQATESHRLTSRSGTRVTMNTDSCAWATMGPGREVLPEVMYTSRALDSSTGAEAELGACLLHPPTGPSRCVHTLRTRAR